MFYSKKWLYAAALMCSTSLASAHLHAATAQNTEKNTKSAAPKQSAKTTSKPVAKPVAKTQPPKGKAVAAAKPNAKNKITAKARQHERAGQHTKSAVQAQRAVPKVRQAAIKPDPLVAEHWTGPLSLGSASVLVMDTATGDSVYQKNAGSVMPIASISKLMTAMVVLDAGLPMDEKIMIGHEDVDMVKGSQSRIPVGATMTRETALLVALMSSDNRAAHALGRHYPGGLPAFIRAMNQKAQALDMHNSHFVEPTGLSSQNVSTARDLARMVTAASNYSKIRELSTTADARIQIGKRELDFRNTNALIRNPNWDIEISKTGYISEAGRCLVMHAKVAQRPVAIVLLDSSGKMTRVGDAVRIKKWMEQATGPRHSRGA